VLFAVQQALTPVQLALGEAVKRRVDGALHREVMRVALRSTGIGVLEDQEALDALQDSAHQLQRGYRSPGSACAGLLALIARYARLIGFAGLVAWVSTVVAGLALVAAVLVFRYGNRGGLRKYSQVWARISRRVREGEYLRTLATGGGAAKELRIFGLTAWLADRYARTYLGWLGVLWRERRRIYLWPYLGFTAAGLVLAGVVFVMLAQAGASGAIDLTGLALGLQAAAAALLLGQYYPEADDGTQFGMLAMAGLDRVRAAVDRHEPRVAIEHRPPPPDRPATAGTSVAVRFDRVRFAYPGRDRQVLDGLDLALPAGRCTAIVGLNGAGKTTLVKLLTRLYEPDSGTIRCGDADIRELPVDQWRRQVSVIFQDFVRYELPAVDNIAFGAVHAPRDLAAVRLAAERAGILDALDTLPRGLDTPLSRAYPGGADLSGGQWQRVAIARSLYALAAGARVLVLDEPTAALDVRAEAAFFDQFVELTQGATALLISHRFSSVRRADHIAVLEHGRVSEQGSHAELIAAGGRYAELFALQARRFGEAGPHAENGDPPAWTEAVEELR
jgi:ATP-binding cassette subfamily B protein